MRTHTGEKHYKCSVCDKRIANKQTLQDIRQLTVMRENLCARHAKMTDILKLNLSQQPYEVSLRTISSVWSLPEKLLL